MPGNVLQLKAAWAAYALPMAAAPSSSGLVGVQSGPVTNSGEYVDALVSGKITVGASPTGGRIEVWVGAPINGFPVYPDTFSSAGSGAAVTLTSLNMRDIEIQRGAVAFCDTTSSRAYFFAPFSVAALFGRLPEIHFVWVTHSTGVNLDGTAGNHEMSYRFFGQRYT